MCASGPCIFPTYYQPGFLLSVLRANGDDLGAAKSPHSSTNGEWKHTKQRINDSGMGSVLAGKTKKISPDHGASGKASCAAKASPHARAGASSNPCHVP
jgi:hypothetical protein